MSGLITFGVGVVVGMTIVKGVPWLVGKVVGLWTEWQKARGKGQ